MKFKTINNNKKILLIPVIVFVVVLSLIINTSLAKYTVTKSIPIASGIINYSPADFVLMGIYIQNGSEYESVEEIPVDGYEFNSEVSYCEKSGVKQEVELNYDIETKNLTITPFTIKGLKCYLYFDESDKEPPTITTQPTNVIVLENGAAVFNVETNDSSATYQWQYRTSSSGTWTNSPTTGNTTNTITVSTALNRNGYQYRCIITDEAGNTSTSNEATLTVVSITTQPSNKTVTVGTNATFSIGLSSTSGITYQWQYRTSSSGTWTNSPTTGNTTNTITVSTALSRNGYQYRCIITDSSGNTLTSNEATLTVNRITISTVPTQSGTLTYSGSSQAPSWNNYNTTELTIGGTVTGTNAGSYTATFTPTANYQWSDGTQTAKNVTWSIGKASISTVPTQSGTLTYTGSAQSPSWSNYNTSQLTIGGTTSGTNAGTYTATFTPTSNYKWSDGSTSKNANWTIGKAAGSLSVSPTTLTINKGATGSITVTRSGNGTISASSSNTSTATVSVSGTTVTVTGVAGGSATITISVGAGTNHTAPTNKTVSVTVKASAKETILANITTITTRTSFSTVVTSSSTKTIYTADDNDGTSYYFSGAVTDNYLKFANKYWRIVRINGDGTIRIIYDGTTARTNGTSSTDTQIGTSRYYYYSNIYNVTAEYVGYMYTIGSVHGTGTSSIIKGVLDNWYTNNLASYASYVDTGSGFCNDRTPYTDSSGTTSGGGTGTTQTYFGPNMRQTAPSLKCNSSDLFTMSGSTKGNKALSKPIGLITSDEVTFGGGKIGTPQGSTIGSIVVNPPAKNINYYLYTGQAYWTISPAMFIYSEGYPFAKIFNVTSEGNMLNNFGDLSTLGVRPVINLRADVTLTGTGTSSNPYVVS